MSNFSRFAAFSHRLLSRARNSVSVEVDGPTFAANFAEFVSYGGMCVQMAFGDAWGFAFLWTKFWVNKNGSLAIVAITFSRYIVAGVSRYEFRD